MTPHSHAVIPALVHKAFRDVTQRRIRSLLTLLGILIGVSGLVAIVSTGQNLARAQAAAYADASQADITFDVWDAPASITRAVEEIENVRAAELRTDFFTRCRLGRRERGGGAVTARDVRLLGIEDFAAMRIDRVYLRAGRFPAEGEIVAEQSALQVMPLRFGDTPSRTSVGDAPSRTPGRMGILRDNVSEDTLTCRGYVGAPERTFTLVGIVQSPNYPAATILDYVTLFAPSSEIRRLLGTTGSNRLLIKLDSPTGADETARAIAQLLDRRGISHGAPNIRDPENYLGKRELDALLTLLAIFSVVGLVTSAFLVANTLAALTAEQVGEIGAIKAIGATRWQVMIIYLTSTFLYGVVGTGFGLAAGVFAGWRLMLFIGSLLNLTISLEVSPFGLWLGACVGLGVTMVAGAIPALSATRISVKRALEAYGITPTYGVGRVDRIVQRIVALPPLAAMSIRNLARRKSRALVTMFVIGVAVAASLAAQAVSASVNAAIDDLFQTYRADAWVWFGEWVGDNMAAHLRAQPGVERVEIWSLQDVWVTKRANGAQTIAARARLWGLPADTRLYAPKLVAGRWYRADERSTAVVSTDLVQSLDLKVGDEIIVDAGTNPRRFRVVGVAVDNSVFLGSQVAGKVFLSEVEVSQMLRREGLAFLFALGLDRHEAAQVDTLSRKMPIPPGVRDGASPTDMRDSVSVDRRLDEIAERFKRYQMGSDSAAREVRGAREQSQILTIALAVMSVLVGVIGALGVLNTITLNVLERRREIGVLRAIGASDANIVQTFVTEGLAFGVGGWLIGIILGYPLGLGMLQVIELVLFEIEYLFTPQMVLVSLVFALALTLASSLVPALAAARVKVREVLRYE